MSSSKEAKQSSSILSIKIETPNELQQRCEMQKQKCEIEIVDKILKGVKYATNSGLYYVSLSDILYKSCSCDRNMKHDTDKKLKEFVKKELTSLGYYVYLDEPNCWCFVCARVYEDGLSWDRKGYWKNESSNPKEDQKLTAQEAYILSAEKAKELVKIKEQARVEHRKEIEKECVPLNTQIQKALEKLATGKRDSVSVKIEIEESGNSRSCKRYTEDHFEILQELYCKSGWDFYFERCKEKRRVYPEIKDVHTLSYYNKEYDIYLVTIKAAKNIK